MKTFLKLLPVAFVFALEFASVAKAGGYSIFEPRMPSAAVAAVRG